MATVLTVGYGTLLLAQKRCVWDSAFPLLLIVMPLMGLIQGGVAFPDSLAADLDHGMTRAEANGGDLL